MPSGGSPRTTGGFRLAVFRSAHFPSLSLSIPVHSSVMNLIGEYPKTCRALRQARPCRLINGSRVEKIRGDDAGDSDLATCQQQQIRCRCPRSVSSARSVTVLGIVEQVGHSRDRRRARCRAHRSRRSSRISVLPSASRTDSDGDLSECAGHRAIHRPGPVSRTRSSLSIRRAAAVMVAAPRSHFNHLRQVGLQRCGYLARSIRSCAAAGLRASGRRRPGGAGSPAAHMPDSRACRRCGGGDSCCVIRVHLRAKCRGIVERAAPPGRLFPAEKYVMRRE